MKVLKTCFEIYRFIDYIHDRKKYVPLKSLYGQPPKYLIDAYLYKMKADYMKFMFETLDCENGLLYKVDDLENFRDDVIRMHGSEIAENRIEK